MLFFFSTGSVGASVLFTQTKRQTCLPLFISITWRIDGLISWYLKIRMFVFSLKPTGLIAFLTRSIGILCTSWKCELENREQMQPLHLWLENCNIIFLFWGLDTLEGLLLTNLGMMSIHTMLQGALCGDTETFIWMDCLLQLSRTPNYMVIYIMQWLGELVCH